MDHRGNGNGRKPNYKPVRSGQSRLAAPVKGIPSIPVKTVNAVENGKPARGGRLMEMDRCPFEGGTAALERDELNWYFVQCKTCFACGPMRPHAESAIAAWNERFPVGSKKSATELG